MKTENGMVIGTVQNEVMEMYWSFVISAVSIVLLIVAAKGGQYYSSLNGCSDKLCVWLGFAFVLITLSASSVVCFIWGIINLWRK